MNTYRSYWLVVLLLCCMVPGLRAAGEGENFDPDQTLDAASVATLVLTVPTLSMDTVGLGVRGSEIEKNDIATLSATRQLFFGISKPQTTSFLSAQGVRDTPWAEEQKISWNLLRAIEEQWPVVGRQFSANITGSRDAAKTKLIYNLSLNGQWQEDGTIHGIANGALSLGGIGIAKKIENAPFELRTWNGSFAAPKLLKGPLCLSGNVCHTWLVDAPPGAMPENLTIKDVLREGQFVQTVTGNQLSPGYRFPDAPGARNIRIEIDPRAKATTFAGLTFHKPCVLDIETNGYVYVNRQGIEARDVFGILWRSDRPLGGGPNEFLFFADEASNNQSFNGGHPLTQPLPDFGQPPITGLGVPPQSTPNQSVPNPQATEEQMRARLPAFRRTLPEGDAAVNINNPNDYSVMVGLRSGRSGFNFLVPPRSTHQVSVPDGSYKIYFVFSTNVAELLKGDDFSLDIGDIIKIKIVRVVGGNYAIRPVN